MKARFRLAAAMVVLLAHGAPVWAAQGAGEAEALARETQAELRRHAQALVACRERFAATACADDEREHHRRILTGLQARQRSLDSARRLERSQARDLRVGARQASVATRAPEAAASEPASAQLARGPVAAPAPASSGAAVDAARPRDQRAAEAARAAAQRASAAQQLQQRIREDQARIAARQARRASEGKESRPLPPP